MSRDRYSYQYASSRDARPLLARVLAVLLAIAAIGLLLMAKQPMVAHLRVRLLAGLSPALELVAQPVDGLRGMLRDKDAFFSALEENKKLREENDTLRRWQAVALALKAENESLRGLSGYQPVENAKYVTARVIGQSARGYGATITLNAGSSSGIATYQPVIDAQGLVGRVTTVSEHAAQVLLLSDVLSRVPVITGNSRQHAILAGGAEDLLRLTFLGGDAKDITLGEPVVTTEEGDLIPGGIRVGTVFARDAQGLLVKPPRPVAQAEYVRVVVAK